MQLCNGDDHEEDGNAAFSRVFFFPFYKSYVEKVFKREYREEKSANGLQVQVCLLRQGALRRSHTQPT